MYRQNSSYSMGLCPILRLLPKKFASTRPTTYTMKPKISQIGPSWTIVGPNCYLWCPHWPSDPAGWPSVSSSWPSVPSRCPLDPEGQLEGSEGLLEGLEGWLEWVDRRAGQWMDGRIDGISPNLQKFVPCQSGCPATLWSRTGYWCLLAFYCRVQFGSYRSPYDTYWANFNLRLANFRVTLSHKS